MILFPLAFSLKHNQEQAKRAHFGMENYFQLSYAAFGGDAL